jgi:hypothetical protein
MFQRFLSQSFSSQARDVEGHRDSCAKSYYVQRLRTGRPDRVSAANSGEVAGQRADVDVYMTIPGSIPTLEARK